MKKNSRKIKLYWVEDFYEGGSEDWFVFAPSKRQAEKFFINYEGMGDGDAEAELVDNSPDCHKIGSKVIKENITRSQYQSLHAQIEELKQLGFTIISDGKDTGQRIVRKGTTTYFEGAMEAKVQLAMKVIDDSVAKLGVQNN